MIEAKPPEIGTLGLVGRLCRLLKLVKCEYAELTLLLRMSTRRIICYVCRGGAFQRRRRGCCSSSSWWPWTSATAWASPTAISRWARPHGVVHVHLCTANADPTAYSAPMMWGTQPAVASL